MRRREFLSVLSGAAAAWPVVARAQQGERVRRIGILMNGAADDSEAHTYLAAFQQGMQELGWSVGRNLQVDLRWGAGDRERTRRHAAELVALFPDVILAAGGPVVLAVRSASSTVPIVFAQSIDPVGAGYVQSLARPGGNATGFTQFEYSLSSKWPELLKEIVPGIRRVGVLRDSTTPPGLANGRSSSPPRRRPEWKLFRSRFVTPPRWSAAWLHSRASRTVAWSCRRAQMRSFIVN